MINIISKCDLVIQSDLNCKIVPLLKIIKANLFFVHNRHFCVIVNNFHPKKGKLNWHILGGFIYCSNNRYIVVNFKSRDNNGYIIYVDIMTGEKFRQFKWLTWTWIVYWSIRLTIRRGRVGVKGVYRIFSQLQVSLY